jgi:hypothetical protein
MIKLEDDQRIGADLYDILLYYHIENDILI